MNRKMLYTLGLAGFFLMWGVFGFVAGAPHNGSTLQATQPTEAGTAAPLEPASSGVPVTGEPKPILTEIVVFYGLIGLTALFLTLALLNFANRWTSPYRQPGSRSPDETKEK